MIKKCTLIAAAFALVFTVVAGGISIAKDTGPAEMILKTAKAKKPAKFPHAKHQAANDCATCHHTKTDDGKQGPYVEGQEKACATCHNKDMANKKLNSFKKAAHARCKGCHKETKKGPTKCKGCHIKKK
jgi:hypothetical protein